MRRVGLFRASGRADELPLARDGWRFEERVTAKRGIVSAMAGNVVNLNRFRKKKAREEKAKQAEINRIRHGRTTAQREQEAADRARLARLIEGKRLVHEDDPSETRTAVTPENPDVPPDDDHERGR